MSTDTFVALLLVSTFATVGIVTVVAARSSRHWFLRTAVVVAMLAPLLAIPAPELFAALLLEAATIAAGITVVRLIRTRAADLRFSLLSLVLATGLAGALLAVGRSLPELNRYAWQSLVLMGVGSGLCVLLGLAAMAHRPHWYWRLPPIVLASLLLGLVLAWFDWLVPSLQESFGWPPDVNEKSIYYRAFANDKRPLTLWLAICPAITAVVFVWFTVQSMAGFALCQAGIEASGKTNARGARTLFVSLTVMIALLPAAVLFLLLTPGDDPRQKLPSPNAYDTIVEVAGAMHRRAYFFDYDSTPAGSLAMSVIDIERHLDTLQAALHGESRVLLGDSRMDVSQKHLDFPNLALALLARGRLDRLEGRHQEAYQSYLDAIRLGYAIRSGGTLFDASIGMDTSKNGFHQLYRYRYTLSPQQCRDAVATLLNLESNVDSFEQFYARDRAWVRTAHGWHGHVRQIAWDVSGMSHLVVKSERDSFLLDRAVMRLLIVELTLNAYELEHGDAPASLSELVPDYLPSVPLDPFDDACGELQYTTSGDEYVLYSLGGNRSDEGGALPLDGSTVIGAKGTGDLLLRVLFTDIANQTGVLPPGSPTPGPNGSPPASLFRRHRSRHRVQSRNPLLLCSAQTPAP